MLYLHQNLFLPMRSVSAFQSLYGQFGDYTDYGNSACRLLHRHHH